MAIGAVQGLVKTYFGWNASAEVRGAALRGVGGGGASFGNLYFQDPTIPFFGRQLRARMLPDPPLYLLLLDLWPQFRKIHVQRYAGNPTYGWFLATVTQT